MDDKTFDKILGTPEVKGWQRFGLRQNPFPSRAHPVWDVFYNQVPVRARFETELTAFVASGATTTLLLTGGNRIGKTHFMEFYRRALPKQVASRALALPIAVLSAQSGDFVHFYRQLIEQVDDCLRQQTGAGFFQHDPPEGVLQELDGALPPGDLRHAVRKYLTAKDRGELSSLLRRWIRGERLRQSQRSIFDVIYSIDSPGPMLNAIGGLVKYLRWIGAGQPQRRCPGVLIFLDEFELVWKLRRDRRDQFLQALREMLDSCENGLFLCIGMATGLGVEVSNVEAAYPALYARLRGHAQRTVPALVQVNSVIDAIGYADAFIRHGREHSGLPVGRKQVLADDDILSKKDIENSFIELGGSQRSVAQGDFFDRLHELAEQKVRG